jgi:hypothetical protein
MKSIPYAREMYHAWETGDSPSLGLISSAATSVLQVPKDVSEIFKNYQRNRPFPYMTRDEQGKMLKDFVAVLGISRGIAPLEFGKIGKQALDQWQGVSHARGPVSNVRGFATGTAPEDRRKR